MSCPVTRNPAEIAAARGLVTAAMQTKRSNSSLHLPQMGVVESAVQALTVYGAGSNPGDAPSHGHGAT